MDANLCHILPMFVCHVTFAYHDCNHYEPYQHFTNVFFAILYQHSDYFRPAKILLSVLKFNVRIGVKCNTYIRMTHQILKRLGINSGLRHIAAVSMSAYVWCYFWYRDAGSIPGSGRSSGGGHGNPL